MINFKSYDGLSEVFINPNEVAACLRERRIYAMCPEAENCLIVLSCGKEISVRGSVSDVAKEIADHQ